MSGQMCTSEPGHLVAAVRNRVIDDASFEHRGRHGGERFEHGCFGKRAGLFVVLLSLFALAVEAAPPTRADGPGLAAHCSCLDAANRAYDPYSAFDDPHMRTPAGEIALRRWAWVERLYRQCMQRLGVAPRADAFPHGVSDYPDGPEFHPAQCEPQAR